MNPDVSDPAAATRLLDPQNWPAVFSAGHMVALLAGGILIHAYHSVVRAGGVKRIWGNFWNGPDANTRAGGPTADGPSEPNP